MTVTVNGAPRSVADGLTLSQLVAELGLQKNPIAVELNRSVVPRDRHAETRLAEGDRLEIVTLVGGG
ncbi:MAG TPA: sulfur carrier protein ThiS [Planctomycetota bacterium]|nr:sulfur carrier protein ThiS [Planctomycetota bacterium]